MSSFRQGLVSSVLISIVAVSAMADPLVILPRERFNYPGNTCPNEPPNYCNCNADMTAFAAAWPALPGHGSLTLASDWANCATGSGFRGWAPPFAMYLNKDTVRQNYRDLAAFASALDPTKNAINGTDDNPLVLEIRWNIGQATGTEWRTSFYAQFFADGELAPVRHTVPDPLDPEQQIEVPLTFQVGETCTNILNASHIVPRKAIAFGFRGGNDGLVPKRECPELDNQIYQHVLYDGQRWLRMAGNYPNTGENMLVGYRGTQAIITIKSQTIDLWVNSRISGTWTLATRTGIPRQYLGGFQGFALGTSAPSQYPGYADDIYIYGGELSYVVSSAAGACCKPDRTCESLSVSECEAIEGARFQGAGVVCGVAAGRCCAEPMVDGNFDGFVDMVDFAQMQRCITVGAANPTIGEGCACFDTNDDGMIDETDIVKLIECASGPGVPADPDCGANPPAL